ANYLDGIENTNGDNIFTSLEYTPENDASSFNDRVIAITHNELMRQVGPAAARRIKQELDADYITNGGDYRDCADLIDRPCPWAESSIYDAMNKDWLASESWNSINGFDFYINWPTFIVYFRYSTTLYFRDPPGSPPELRFSGCSGMAYTLDIAGDITRD